MPAATHRSEPLGSVQLFSVMSRHHALSDAHVTDVTARDAWLGGTGPAPDHDAVTVAAAVESDRADRGATPLRRRLTRRLLSPGADPLAAVIAPSARAETADGY